MILGTISTTGNQITKASTNIVMGEAIDAFRGNGNAKHVVYEVSKVSLKFAILGVAFFLAAFLRAIHACTITEVACWVSNGERQVARIRGVYLKAISRQDIRFFDKETNTGEVVGRMSGDTVLLIQEAMGERVLMDYSSSPKEVQYSVKGWLLTLVLLSCIPPLVLSNSIMSFTFAKLASRGQAAYSEAAQAATVVDRTIGLIRTDENQVIAQYDQPLIKAYRTAVQDGMAAGLVVQDIATVIIAFAIAFEANWQLSLIIIVLLPLLLVNGQLQMGSMQGFVSDAKVCKSKGKSNSSGWNDVARKGYCLLCLISTNIHLINVQCAVYVAVWNIRTVASFCAEEKVLELYQKKCSGPIQTGIKQAFMLQPDLLRMAKHQSQIDVFRVFFTLTMAAIAMLQSGFRAPGASKAKNSMASTFSILEQKSNIDPSDESGMMLQEVRGEIEFHHVTFKYPTRLNVLVFRYLSFTIHAGEENMSLFKQNYLGLSLGRILEFDYTDGNQTVALAGESGSGKSIIITLLQRFYDPESGQITLDGSEIRNLQLKRFRQQMGLVSQEPILFNESIRANAHTFISSLQQLDKHSGSTHLRDHSLLQRAVKLGAQMMAIVTFTSSHKSLTLKFL
ncbi:unnamed protein product [Sphenostylis stenocarpa]|uniref:ABC transmembrane type-1 domain-containing protein n=1 Tax=Sphenostylis stenocarpa TaxID=92480 RepID=A0AA86SUX9_9FABA|nr:unnamed protein product [Sphenostylis stenocarpa]